MAGSNFSIVNGSDGVSKVPISTPANDANGNSVVGHLIMTAISGVATPVDATHPMAVAASSLPLPTGAATDASLGTLNTALGRINTTLAAPVLPTGAATDASLGSLNTALGRINTTLATPTLPPGAATDASLGTLNTALGKINTTLATPALPPGAATDASLGTLNTALGRINTTLGAPPLPAGAATDAALATLAAALGRVTTALAALQATEAPFQGVVVMTPDQAQTAQRAIRINCTVAGNVSLTYVDGSKDTIPVAVGLNYIAGAFTTVNSAGTSATATYANMR